MIRLQTFCFSFLIVLDLVLVARAVPADLRCQGLVDPAGIDAPAPRLSWILLADQPGERNISQTAYQILAASTSDRLTKEDGDLWDSGRVQANDSQQINYLGKPLASGQQIFWKVKVWTNADQPGSWSAPTRWTMGLLLPQGWEPARWISLPAAINSGNAMGYHAEPTQDSKQFKWVQVDLGSSRHINAVRMIPMDHAGIQGFAFPLRFKVEASDEPDFKTATTLVDHTAEDFTNPGMTPVNIPTSLDARFLRVTATRLVHRNNGYCFALAELQAISDGTNVAAGAKVTALDSVEQFGWSKTGLTDSAKQLGSTVLRREFAVRPRLRHAVMFVTGLGQYELSINGQKIGKQLLSPGWTDYRKTVLYDTFDVTGNLQTGDNAVGIILGNGMYSIQPTSGRYVKFTQSFGPPKAIARLVMEYDDGSIETLVSDRQWKAAPGPITYSNVYGGEDFDARMIIPNWDRPGTTDPQQWQDAKETQGPGGQLRGQSASAPAIEAIESHVPISMKELSPGVTICDLGQNASNMPELRVHGPPGSSVRIIPSELLGPHGDIDRASCVQDAGGPAWWQYTLAGTGDEHFFPKFFYQGCRYFRVEVRAPQGGGDLPVIDSVAGVVVHSSSEPISTFECSNDLFNRTYALVRWAQRSNMMSLMTDCPHREKLGWLEELHLNGPSLRYNFRMDNLYAKEMNDMADAQLSSGFVPNIAPEYFLAHTDRLDDPFRNSPEWGSAIVIVPWQQYLFTGDLDLLRDHYSQMARYVEFLAASAKSGILTVGLGDWYDIGPKPPWGSQLTPPPFTATAIYFYDTMILANTADLLGHPDQAKQFRQQAEVIRGAINKNFFDPKLARYATGSQCANAMALALGIAEPADRPAVLANLIADIRARGNALSAGDVGYRFVLRALADAGRSDVIFDMNNQSDRPGYGMQLKRGATSLTEKWDASVGKFGSQDHFMLGQINEWFFHDLAGIQSDSDAPGFSHIIIKPAIVGDLTRLKATYRSNHGTIVVEWKKQDGELQLSATVPPNTSATIDVPASDPASVKQIGQPIGIAVPSPAKRPGYVAFTVGSGTYLFSSR